MFVERFGVMLLRFSFLFLVLLNLSFHLLFNIIGGSPAWFVSKKNQQYKRKVTHEIFFNQLFSFNPAAYFTI